MLELEGAGEETGDGEKVDGCLPARVQVGHCLPGDPGATVPNCIWTLATQCNPTVMLQTGREGARREGGGSEDGGRWWSSEVVGREEEGRLWAFQVACTVSECQRAVLRATHTLCYGGFARAPPSKILTPM